MTAHANSHANAQSPAPTPLEALAAKLRTELAPATQLEQMFFDQIVRLSVLASFLMNHIAADPELANPETTRRMRLLLSNESRLRYAYEEFRRLKLAHQLQQEDPELASAPILAIVARNTTRNGYRAPRRSAAAPTPPIAATPARASAANAARLAPANAARVAPANAVRVAPAPAVRVAPPGRNAQCPCGSGLKYKRCCANRQAAAA